MMTIVTSVFGPLIPAISSMQSASTPSRIGDLCIRTTRYCALLLCLLGAPLFFGAYPLLSLWVGKQYAARSAFYLEVLVLGNIVRYLSMPYLAAVIATGKQHFATLATVTEACVNIVLSIWLVQRIGAVGVAVGTLVAAFVSIGVHLFVSIPRTQGAIRFKRPRFLMQGWVRPLLIITPSLLLYPFWRKQNMLPAAPAALATWAVAVGAMAWWLVLTAEDRLEARRTLFRLLYSRAGQV
jgi:O-antigen/teichoic acid export membrane protein